jgi:hypothetical protein
MDDIAVTCGAWGGFLGDKTFSPKIFTGAFYAATQKNKRIFLKGDPTLHSQMLGDCLQCEDIASKLTIKPFNHH